MSGAGRLEGLDEAALGHLAELIALKVAVGDAIALAGDLGAGKTTFARALIRALLGEPEAEVPSPTFPLLQPYATPRLPVAHLDLYRLAGSDDLAELGYDDALARGLVVIEWPERAADALPADRLEVHLDTAAEPDRRHVRLVAHGSWQPRLERLLAIRAFIAKHLPPGTLARIAYLQGDASTRAYARITTVSGATFVLMDSPAMPDGPVLASGQPYSRIAHLAEDVRPFVAIGGALETAGLSVPHIHAADLDAGLLLLEDLGDLTFGRALQAGHPQPQLWHAAVDVLIGLRRTPPPAVMPLPDGTSHTLPRFDRAHLEIELSLLLDWYWPDVMGSPVPDAVRAEFTALWSPVLDRLLAAPPGLFLRDYHSPNLFWLPDRDGVSQVGVIDFQDALAESWAFDLVSLLQDARVDVPAALETAERCRYMAEVARAEPGFDRDAFEATYAAFGAQRNTRLVGLWVRLLRRDGKANYLQHMPRTWDYLERNLAHPTLAPLRDWYDTHIPHAVRTRPIAP